MKYSIKVSEVKNGSENLRGIATVVLGDSFKLGNIMILNNPKKDELFVAMPSYRTSQVITSETPVFSDIFYPTTAEFRNELYKNILDAFTELQEHQAGNSYKVVFNEKDTTMPEFDVRVTPYEKEGSNIKGLVTVKIADCIAINNITVKESKEGNLYVDMPSYKAKQLDDKGNAVYKDFCNPVTAKFASKLGKAIMDKLEAAKEKIKESVIDKLSDKKEAVSKQEAKKPEKERNQPNRDEAR